MPTRYQIQVYNTSGEKLAVIDDYVSINYKKRINNFSTHTIVLKDTDAKPGLFTTDAIIEIMRKTDYQDWTRDYIGFHRTPRHQLTTLDTPLFWSYGRSLEDLLNRHVVINMNTFFNAIGEDVMKSIVDQNSGPNNTHGNTHINLIQPSLGRGEQWSGQRDGPRLLDLLREIAEATRIDFSVEVSLVPLTFEFRVSEPFDRSRASAVPHLIGPAYGNVRGPDYTISRTEEANVIIARNKGDAVSITTQDDDAVNLSPWNDIESIYETDYFDEEYLHSVAQAELAELAAKENFSCELIQTPKSQYGRDYFVGDLITVEFKQFQIDQRIVAVDISVGDGKETIRTEISNSDPKPQLEDIIRGLVARIKRVEEQL